MNNAHSSSSVLAWSYYHALAMLLALLGAWWFSRIELLLFTSLLSFAGFIGFHKNQFKFGYASGVTLLRLFLLVVAVYCYTSLPVLLVAGLLFASLVLDGFDGYLARRFSETSEFGQYFDVETDAFAIALLSFLLWQQHDLTAWIVLAGALRYTYLWLIRLTVFEQRTEPKRRYASVVAVTVYIVMTLRLISDWMVFDVALWIALVALCASFLRSALYQWGFEKI